MNPHKHDDLPEALQAELYEEEAQTRRLQLVVYPSLIAFIVLASYGFYLIYSLTRDVHQLAQNVATLTQSVDRNMTRLSADVGTMNAGVIRMTEAVVNMQRDMWSLNQNVSTPLSVVNRMIPFSNNSSGRYPGSPGPMPYMPPVMPGMGSQ